MKSSRLVRGAVGVIAGMTMLASDVASGQGVIDNSSLGSPLFREHKRTFGLVYVLPDEVNDRLTATVGGLLREKLMNLELYDETLRFNIPHVTVLHVHNADPTTPARMLDALPKLPVTFEVRLKTFYAAEAARDAGRPWWFDLGIVKEGPGFETMMAFNTAATAALAPLRDGPLPRVTGPVFAAMSNAARDLVRSVGVSGVNMIRDGQETRAHNPHTTLVYSMARFTPELQAALNQTAVEFNQILPDGIDTFFRSVSIVELGFTGNVLREIYRISLVDGSVLDVATGAKKAK